MTTKSKLFDYDNPQNCITHHHACECREAKFAKVIEAAKKAVDNLIIDETLSNSQLRYLHKLDITIRDLEDRK